jgi:hypothetical protein
VSGRLLDRDLQMGLRAVARRLLPVLGYWTHLPPQEAGAAVEWARLPPGPVAAKAAQYRPHLQMFQNHVVLLAARQVRWLLVARLRWSGASARWAWLCQANGWQELCPAQGGQQMQGLHRLAYRELRVSCWRQVHSLELPDHSCCKILRSPAGSHYSEGIAWLLPPPNKTHSVIAPVCPGQPPGQVDRFRYVFPSAAAFWLLDWFG